MKNSRRKNRFKEIVLNHLIINKREYIIILLLFIIGIFLGVLFVNNIKQEQLIKINNYLNDFVEQMKSIEKLDNIKMLKTSVTQNLGLAFLIFFFGTTVIGLPIVFGLIVYRGFCLGYTISSCITVLSTSKGLAFIVSDLLLQNLIFIPAIIAIAVSGFKLYKSIIKDKRKDNIKIEIIRHIAFCSLMSIFILLSSVVEVFLSNNLLKIVVNYF